METMDATNKMVAVEKGIIVAIISCIDLRCVYENKDSGFMRDARDVINDNFYILIIQYN